MRGWLGAPRRRAGGPPCFSTRLRRGGTAAAAVLLLVLLNSWFRGGGRTYRGVNGAGFYLKVRLLARAGSIWAPLLPVVLSWVGPPWWLLTVAQQITMRDGGRGTRSIDLLEGSALSIRRLKSRRKQLWASSHWSSHWRWCKAGRRRCEPGEAACSRPFVARFLFLGAVCRLASRCLYLSSRPLLSSPFPFPPFRHTCAPRTFHPLPRCF